MLTAADRPGRQTYERSVVFLMLAAFYDTVGAERVRRVSVEYSISRALFIRAKGDFTLNQTLLDRVEERMRQLVRQAVPIRKTSLSTEDAVELFRSRGMLDKAQLLSFRISSRVNVYSLEDFSDYFYGYMVPDTSYLKWFALQIFEDGFVLRLPDLRDPCRLGAFTPPIKVFQALHDAALRSEALHISNVAEMNQRISQGGATQMILSQEALMEKQIGDIAEEIAKRRDVRFVMIAGPSSSGKTTFSHRLSTQLLARGMRLLLRLLLDIAAVALYVYLISVDLNGGDWYLGLAAPIILWGGAILLLLGLVLRGYRRSALTTLTILIGSIGVFVFGMEFFVDRWLHQLWSPSWSLVVLTICIGMVIPLIIIRRVPALREEARRRFHL